MFEYLPSIPELFEFIKKSILQNEFAQGGFVMAVVTSTLYAIPKHVLPFFQFIYGRIERLVVYHVNIEQTDDLYGYFELWLSDKHSKKYRNVEAALRMNTEDWYNYDIVSGKELDVFDEKLIYKQFEDTFLIRKGLHYIRVFKGREKLENASSLKSAHYNKFKLSGIFGKRKIDALIREVHEYAKDRMKAVRMTAIRVKISNQHGDWVDQTCYEPKDMENIILDNKDELLDDINKFLSKKKWYKDRNIMFKRGYLFSGAAGCGKTSFALSLAKYLDRTIYIMQLNNIDDESMRSLFKNLPSNSILLIEDIDAAFNKRDNGKDIKFAFSTLLNCMDGVFSTEDVITIFTTNHRENLDHALLRKGRIDYDMVFKRPSKENMELFLTDFYQKPVEVKFDVPRCIPMVDVQDACLRNMDDPIMALKEIKETQERVISKGLENLDISVQDG